MELVSVIVSVYNQADILRLTLASLMRQDYDGPFEVIVCDDGSDSQTFDVIRTVSALANIDLVYIWQPDRSFRAARSRNTAIRSARGRRMIFIDGDIVVPTHFISRHIDILQKHGDQAIVAGFRKWLTVDLTQDNISCLEDLERYALSKAYQHDREYQERSFATPLPWMACCGFNFSLFKQPEVYYDEHFIGWGKEDYDLFCRLYHCHEFQIVLDDANEVLHIVTPTYSDLNPWIASTHENIAAYVANCIYFKMKYADLDVTAALWPLQHFTLNNHGSWERVRNGNTIPLVEAIRRAESWVHLPHRV